METKLSSPKRSRALFTICRTVSPDTPHYHAILHALTTAPPTKTPFDVLGRPIMVLQKAEESKATPYGDVSFSPWPTTTPQQRSKKTHALSLSAPLSRKKSRSQ